VPHPHAREITHDPSRAFLGKSLTTAEAVMDGKWRGVFRDLGVETEAQGYFFARLMPVANFRKLLELA
jgi:hypothetical protein